MKKLMKQKKYPILVTELKNGKDSLFMVENIGNSTEQTLYNKRATDIEIDLSKLKGDIRVYYKGKQVEREIKDGKLIEKMKCGQAIFIEVIR